MHLRQELLIYQLEILIEAESIAELIVVISSDSTKKRVKPREVSTSFLPLINFSKTLGFTVVVVLLTLSKFKLLRLPLLSK